ncbi:MAG: DNA translocase FtsK 4TM domain-containing protein [Chloroflexota bacterium]
MPQSAAAKKTSKPSGPTWSKLEGGKSKQAPARSSAAKPSAAKPAAKSASRSTASRSTQSRKPTPIRPAKKAAPLVISPVVRREMVALGMLVVAALFVVGLLTWLGGSDSSIVGVAGGVLAQLFGAAAWLVPVALVAVSIFLFMARSSPQGMSPLVPIGMGLLLLGLMGFVHIFAQGQQAADAGQGGGYIGLALSTLLSDYLTKAGAGVVLFAVMLTGFMLAFGLSLAQLVRGVGQPTVAAGRFASAHVTRIIKEREAAQSLSRGSVRINGKQVMVDETGALSHEDVEATVPPTTLLSDSHSAPTEVVNLLGNEAPPAPRAEPAKTKPEPVINLASAGGNKATEITSPHEPIQSPLGYVWNLPPVNLLENVGEVKVSQSDLKAKIKVIEDAFQSFNVEAVVREVNTGPAVTQFAVEPGVGVRVSKITGLDRDLALALAAPGIRIEAPIPGQSRVGIEVPNASLQVVGLRSILESEIYHASKARLRIALGRDTHGQPVVTDLAKLPHMLVAGSTGSGKSVFLNSMVIGFLLQFTPDDLRMLMIDPKRVELTGFNGIPHLLRPVVTDVRQEKDSQSAPKGSKTQPDRERPLTAVEALKWALWEMERRYKLFEKGQRDSGGFLKQFRNIEMYRDFKRDNPDVQMEHIPYIVIIIDELADLMLTAPEEVETSLCRLAQLARATGIHLVVATQRPSVDVVTGLIKANFPARAAFAVTSQVDSKVILDGGGAEKLLGRGDMLYNASDESKPVRIQGTFVSDKEADKVVNFWRKQLPTEEEMQENGVSAPLQPMQMPDWLGKGNANEDSELLEQAIELVKKNTYVSTSMLQRKLRVGYNRAARLVEQMEEMGLIAAADADNRGRPREVLLGAPDTRAHPQTFSEIED